MFDLAYVGSKSEDLLRQVQINAVPRGATFLPQNQDPTRAASTMPGATALPTDLLRPYPGYGAIRMWEYSGYSNYHALQTGINRRFDDGLMFSFFYVWSKALGISNDDFSAGLPNATDAEIRRLDYGLREHRSAAQLRRQLRLPAPVPEEQRQRPRQDRGRLAAVGHLPLDERQPAGRRLLDPGHQPVEPDGQRRRQPGRAHRADVRSGRRLRRRPVRAVQHVVLRPPQPGSDGAESARFFMRRSPINNLDLSLSKVFAGPKSLKFEVRIDAFNALNHTQFTGFNGTANFASLTNPTITNPADQRHGSAELRRLRCGQRRGRAAHAAARHPRDVLSRTPRSSPA